MGDLTFNFYLQRKIVSLAHGSCQLDDSLHAFDLALDDGSKYSSFTSGKSKKWIDRVSPALGSSGMNVRRVW